MKCTSKDLVTRLLTVSALVLVGLVGSCGGGKSGAISLNPNGTSIADAQQPQEMLSADQLREVLMQQFSDMGIDPDKVPAAAPSDGFVFDLDAQPFDPDGSGPQAAIGVSLTWTEVLLGDYDQNGEVGFSDLTPLARYYLKNVEYFDPQDKDGVFWWPTGDPLDDFGAGPNLPPLEGSGAYNWRLSRVDGDRNSELNQGDIQPIAAHWMQRLDGYRIYRKGPNDVDFMLLPHPDNPLSPLTVDRPTDVDPNRPVRYSFTDLDATQGVYQYLVKPYDSQSDGEGAPSLIIVVDTASGEVTSQNLIAALLPSTTQGTAPLTVGFDASASVAQDAKIVSYEWDFNGDGLIDENTGATPFTEHTFTENERYKTRLIVTDNTGRTAQTQVEISVLSDSGNSAPQVNLSMSEEESGNTGSMTSSNLLLQGKLPMTVVFDASLSSDSDGTIVRYEWDFDGDGVIDQDSLLPTAVWTYTENATYVVTLRVTDDSGGISTSSATVVVTGDDGNWPPRAALSADPIYGAPPLDVQFDASSSFDPDGQIVKYEWDFNNDGTYERDSGTIPRLPYAFNTSEAHNVWVRVTDDQGATAIARQLVIVNNAPYAALFAQNQQGVAPFEVQLDGSGSFDTDDGDRIVKHEWDFDGDGIFDLNTGTVGIIKHTFFEVGTFQVTLRVTDKFDATAEATISIDVQEPADNALPLASIEAFPNQITEGDSVKLDATLSSDQDGTILRYEWDFDGDQIFDDVTYDTSTIQHTYEDAGTYNATVRVMDNLGGTDKASVTVTVLGATGNMPPTATMTVNPTGGAAPLAVQLDASGSVDTDGTIVKYEWDLNGDGTFEDDSGTTPNNSTILTENGVYNLMVKIHDDEGATAKAIVPVVVGTPPTAKLKTSIDTDDTPPQRVSEDPSPITFDASESFDIDGQITDFSWDINNDGVFEISTGLSPFLSCVYDLQNVEFNADTGQWETRPAIHAIGNLYYPATVIPGNFPSVITVTLRVKDNIGATDTAQVTAIVRNDYDEIEDNDLVSQANFLEGSGPAGEFDPSVGGGDSITGIRPTASDPYIEGAPVLTQIRGNLGFLDANQRGYNGDDNDYFSFTLLDGAHVTIDLLFPGMNSGGADLNLRLLDSDGTSVLFESLTTTDNEEIQYDFRDGGTYYIRANRFLGARADYILTMKAEPIQYYPEGVVDSDNDTQAAADPYQLVLDNNKSAAIGRLGGGDNKDWYKFNLVNNAVVNMSLKFTHAVADLDLELRGPQGELLSFSNTVTDNESIIYTVPSGISGTGYAVVEHAGGGEGNYALSIGYPPASPYNLQATKTVVGNIVLFWSMDTGGNPFDGFELFAADSEEGPFDLVTQLGVNARNYTYATDALHPVWFKIRSFTNGSSAPSEFTDAVYGIGQQLNVPENVKASDGESPNLIYLSWEAPSNGPEPDEYRIRRWNPISGSKTIATVPSSTLEFTDDVGTPDDGATKPANTYHYYIRSQKDLYNASAEATDDGYPALLDGPVGFSASDGTWSDKILMQWTYNGAEEPDGFKIYYLSETPGSNYVEVGDAPGASTRAYLLQKQLAGWYRVRAYKEDYGLSPASNPEYGYAIGLQPPEAFYASQLLNSNTQVYFDWTQPNNGPRPYFYKCQYYLQQGGYDAGWFWITSDGTDILINNPNFEPPAYGEVTWVARIKSTRTGYPDSNWSQITFTIHDNNGT